MILTKLLRPLLRAAAVLAAVVLVLLGLAWVGGTMLIDYREPETAGLPPGVPGRLVSVDGHPVHVVEQGQGSPIVLVHGLGGSTVEFEDGLIDRLAAGHRVIAVDLFGMGFSARDDDFAYGYTLWSEQLRGLLDALGIERAAVVGHSLGGAVATVLAATHPERVGHLVLLASLVPLTDDERRLELDLLETPGAGELALGLIEAPELPESTDAYAARARQAFRIAGTRHALLRYLRDGEEFAALYQALPNVAAPTLVIHGTDDPWVPLTAARRAAPRIPDVLVLPLEAGHFPHRDHPDRVAAEIERFVNGT